jgi:hypothetical protein
MRVAIGRARARPGGIARPGCERVLAFAVLLTLAAVLFGCASDPENTLAPGHEGAPGVKRFFVCAPNTVIALPAELQAETGVLREQVDAYLHWHDRESQWINLYDSKREWTEAIRVAKQQGAIEKAPVLFAQALGKLYDFDAIVMPSILLHKTRATDGYAAWDEVGRRMKVVNAPRRPPVRGQNTLADGIAFGGVTGEVLVTSVHVLVYSREGERVFEGRGGIAFVHDADMAAAMKKYTWEPRMRDPAGDVDAMREGVAIAFHPYLVKPEGD